MKLTGLKQLIESRPGAGGFAGGGGGTKVKQDTDWLDYAKMAGAALVTPPKQLWGGAFGMGSVIGHGKQSATDWAKNTRDLLSGGVGLAKTALGGLGNKIGGPLPPAPSNIAGRAVSTTGKIASTVAPVLAKHGNSFLDAASIVGSAAAGDLRNASLLSGFGAQGSKQNIQKVKIVN
jgi:hypothetical protein